MGLSDDMPAKSSCPIAKQRGEGERPNGEKRRQQTRRRVLAIYSVGLAFMTTFVGVGVWAGLRINLTPSEPLGLWQVVTPDRPAAVGDLVFVCPPSGALSEFGLARGYFLRGLCPSGAAPLIKTIVAIAGARIAVGANVRIDGVPLQHSRLSSKDGQGRALAPWAGGVVPPGQLFLHSQFRGSYDSRYFGPVPETGLLGFARPFLTFASIGTP
ncbi:conjugative transfer signal peptidase TraF [Pleomorphomonas koreensis]|uniref:conjugative transfer signal peptidase TraF n=1 Tax=Pleomorphomonas koreensis TaxID=257440 RepID=UPI0024816205|nr:conjugative transfer signal peptidase TraF [Pleomorphomonas koreensis]